jgi:hypothetical protein
MLGVDGDGAMSGIGTDADDFPPRALLLPPRLEPELPPPRLPRLSLAPEAVVLALACFSPSAFLLPRGRRVVPPREPGPRNGKPVS